MALNIDNIPFVNSISLVPEGYLVLHDNLGGSCILHHRLLSMERRETSRSTTVFTLGGGARQVEAPPLFTVTFEVNSFVLYTDPPEERSAP
jgi:hypothetical protein